MVPAYGFFSALDRIFHSGYLYPVATRNEPNVIYRIFRPSHPALQRIYPNIGSSSEDLARAMVHAGLYGTADHADPII